MKRKVAVLSNVNMNFVVRMLKREFEVYDVEGYGNELALLLNRDSSYHEFAPEVTFFIMDLLELMGHEIPEGSSEPVMPVERSVGQNAADRSGSEFEIPGGIHAGFARLDAWVHQLEGLLDKNRIYYISDGFVWGPETDGLLSPLTKSRVEHHFLERIAKIAEGHSNVRIFPYRQIIERLGVQASFSLKTWYMGKILHSSEAQKQIGEEIKRLVDLEFRVPKKVLVLDLDNTLWGGLAGENDHTPVQLSDDHEGLAYKNEQRVIRQMQEKGVLLAIVSKNNEEDAMEIIREHPHMVLREKDFAARRINWNPKHENILEIAKELNLGTDSFVFWDDNPQEQELVRQMLPEVAVPEFPEKCEDLAGAMSRIYRQYFEKAVITAEDKEKTKQYEENARRSSLEKEAGSFSDYLKQLQIVAEQVDAGENINRLHQLVNKTNQFNPTTRRYEMSEMQETVENTGKKVYLYKVRDCFGDYGIVAAIIVDLTGEADNAGFPAAESAGEMPGMRDISAGGNGPVVEEFAMSCRIMGKNVEYALMQHVEEDLRSQGYERLRGHYIPTAKNKPVEKLYDKLGYDLTMQTDSGEKWYELVLAKYPEREYYVSFE